MKARRRLLIALLAIGAFSVGFFVSVMPASAEKRTIIVTLLGGSHITLTVDVPPGTPLSQIKLPNLGLPIIGISEAAPPPPPAATTTTPATPTTTTTTPTTTAPQAPSPQPSDQKASKQHTTSSKKRHTVIQPNDQAKNEGSSKDQSSKNAKTRAKVHKRKQAPRTNDGAPTPANPTYSLAEPGPAAIGVPNFFIEQFRIPPFLLPIYQAAGTQYGVPWQILAAINEIETDYGRNLSVSTAGAVGWMQFIPSTWKRYGVDANNDGVKDPYNPVDAIFSAARYLHAAGATDTFLAPTTKDPSSPDAQRAAAAQAKQTDQSLRQAIFAYNHAGWYVDSVLLRAQLIGGLPDGLVGALSGLTQGHFPVAARATYADDINEKRALKRVHKGNAAQPVDSTNRTGINIFARKGAPVIAVNDGRIVRIGHSRRLGRFIQLQDGYGNIYTYGKLGSISKKYAAPIPKQESAKQIAKELRLPKDKAPTQPATAGVHRVATHVTKSATDAVSKVAPPAVSTAAQQVQQQLSHTRLFANPTRPNAYKAGGRQQVQPKVGVSTFKDYFADVLHLGRNDVTLKRLKVGSQVIAGTILGRVDKTDPKLAPHMLFEIRPAGHNAPRVDPKPILDGWKLLETTAIYRAAGKNPFVGSSANPTVGQILLESKDQLQRQVLADPRIDIYSCGRRDIESGQIDRRVLATLEFLVANGLNPTVTALHCGHSYLTASGNVSEHSFGDAVDIAKVNGIPIVGHQGPGSITDLTIRRLLTLQGTMKPHQIISLMTFPGADNTLALPDHYDHIHVGFRPIFGPNTKVGQAAQQILKPQQWVKLIDRIGEIPNPTVRSKPSKFAIKDRKNAGD
jgi:murein DD-endopeptidase MepM/ murein hydrolase activator NlpD